MKRQLVKLLDTLLDMDIKNTMCVVRNTKLRHTEFLLLLAKTLPASLIDTTLNLPPGSEEVYLNAHLSEVEVSANLADSVVPPISAYLGTGATLPPVPVVSAPKPPSHTSSQVRKSSPSPRR